MTRKKAARDVRGHAHLVMVALLVATVHDHEIDAAHDQETDDHLGKDAVLVIDLVTGTGTGDVGHLRNEEIADEIVHGTDGVANHETAREAGAGHVTRRGVAGVNHVTGGSADDTGAGAATAVGAEVQSLCQLKGEREQSVVVRFVLLIYIACRNSRLMAMPNYCSVMTIRLFLDNDKFY